MLNPPPPEEDGLTVPLAVRLVLQLMVNDVSVPKDGSNGIKAVPRRPFDPDGFVSETTKVPVPLAVLVVEKFRD
jgi:hypothetical protein